MSVLNVAFYGSDEMASNIAKKGDSRDVVSYVFKETKDEKVRILSLLRPLKHPESIRPLLSVLNVSRVGFVEVKQIDASLGEVLVAMKCSEIEVGIAVINPDSGDWVDPDQVGVLFEQAKLNWNILEEFPEAHEIREELFSLGQSEDESDELVVPLDQKFNVQGIGVVGIGYVQSGNIKKHDQIEIIPGRKPGVVRSLQVMDDDVNEAGSGDRVGVALRGVDEDDIGRMVSQKALWHKLAGRPMRPLHLLSFNGREVFCFSTKLMAFPANINAVRIGLMVVSPEGAEADANGGEDSSNYGSDQDA